MTSEKRLSQPPVKPTQQLTHKPIVVSNKIFLGTPALHSLTSCLICTAKKKQDCCLKLGPCDSGGITKQERFKISDKIKLNGSSIIYVIFISQPVFCLFWFCTVMLLQTTSCCCCFILGGGRRGIFIDSRSGL